MTDKLIKYLLCSFFLLVPLCSWKIKFHGIPVSVDFIIALLVIILFIIKLLFSKNRMENFSKLKNSIFYDKFTIFIVFYIAAALLSFMKSVSIGASINEMLRFLSYIVLYFIIVNEAVDKEYIHSIMICFLITCFVSVLFGFLQSTTGIGLPPEFTSTAANGISRRIGSTMYNPNNYAAFIILSCYPILLSAFYLKNRKIKISLFLLFILLSVSLVLTFSREGWLGFLTGAAVLALIYNRKIFYLLCTLPVIGLLIKNVRERFLSIFSVTSDSNMTRIRLWKTGLMMIKENPIFGVGMGNSTVVYDEYIKKYPELDQGYRAYRSYPLHNSYLKVEAETGILGIISFMFLILYVVFSSFNIYKNADDKLLKGISGGFFISTIGYLLMNIFDNCFFDPQTAVFFWLIFSLIVALNNINSKKTILGKISR